MSHVETIIAMHAYKRPNGSASEYAFIDRFIKPLGAKSDLDGNYILRIGDNPKVLYSSHTDTVHRSSGMQRLAYDGRWLKLHKKASSSCLGADDGAGIWLMREMILAKKPGLYIFHADEEAGCNGSEALAKNNPSVLLGIEMAIAFDRRGHDSIITHMSSRTCSDAFATSLKLQLGGEYDLDPTGSLTDTKSYRRIVPECTNLSVGYESAHTSRERLDLAHLIELRGKLLALDTDKLVIERDNTKPDEFRSYRSHYSGGYYKEPAKDIYDLIVESPYSAAKALEKSGVTFEDLKHLIEIERGSYKTPARTSTGTGTWPSALTDDTLKAPTPPLVSARALTQNGNGMSSAPKVPPFPGHNAVRDDKVVSLRAKTHIKV